MPMTTQLPLPETVDVSVMDPEVVVTFTLNILPESVASTVPGSCLGPISNFSRSFRISLRRQGHCALVVMTVPSCMANGLGSLVFFFVAPAVTLQLAPLFLGD